MFLEFLYWWYGTGWQDMLRRVGHNIIAVTRIFSIPILLTTLISPWKRIITENDGSVEMMFRSMVDNLVSRTIGFVVRSLVLFSASILTLVAAVVGLVVVVLWPLLPLGVVGSLFMIIFGGIVK